MTRRRVALGYTSQRAFAADANMSERTVSAIENNERPSYSRATLAKLEQGLRWTPGSVDAVLAGGDPEPIELATASPPQPAPLTATDTLADLDEIQLIARALDVVAAGSAELAAISAALTRRAARRRRVMPGDLPVPPGSRAGRGGPRAGEGEDTLIGHPDEDDTGQSAERGQSSDTG